MGGGVVIGWDMMVVMVMVSVFGVDLLIVVECLFEIEVVMVCKFNE